MRAVPQPRSCIAIKIARMGWNANPCLAAVLNKTRENGKEHGIARENTCAISDSSCCHSHFPPHIVEIVEALLVGDPLGGAYRALGETAAGGGVVAQIDVVV